MVELLTDRQGLEGVIKLCENKGLFLVVERTKIISESRKKKGLILETPEFLVLVITCCRY